MTNILNALNTTNNNVIPARKLTKNTNGRNSKDVYIPQPTYKYSIYDTLKEKEAERLQFQKDIITKEKREVRKKRFSIIALISTLTALTILIDKKLRK